MGIRFRKRVKLWKGASLNVSGSGLSVSQRVGRTTFNTRGRATTNLGGGFSIQHGGRTGRGRSQAVPAQVAAMPAAPVAQPRKRGCLGTVARLLMWTVVAVVVLALIDALT